MRLVMYQMEHCPFCKHFRRMFYRDVPGGEEVMLEGHDDPGWIEHSLEFVPTVIAYDDQDKEISRLGSRRMIGIRKTDWIEWLRELASRVQ